MLVQIVQALDPSVYEVHIVSLSPEDKANSIFTNCKLPECASVHYLNYVFFEDHSIRGYFKLLRSKAKDIALLPELNALMATVKPDIIHFHTNPMELILRRFMTTQSHYVFTDHLYRLELNAMGRLRTKALALIFRRLYKGFHVMAVSPAIYNRLTTYNVVTKPYKLIALPNGVDTTVSDQGIQITEGLRAVYVSRLEKIKGHADLLKAWSLLSDISDKHLYLVGPDGMNGQLQQMAHDLGINDTVTFTGNSPDPAVWLRQANLGLFPSYNEGLPLALLEKMRAGLPVIVSDIEALEGLLTHGKEGLIYKSGNVGDLAEKIRYIYQHREHALRMGQHALQLVRDRYDLKRNHELLIRFYEDVLKDEC